MTTGLGTRGGAAIAAYGEPSGPVADDGSAPCGDTAELRRLAVETLGDPVIILDDGGRVVDLNPSAARLCDRTPAELLGIAAATVLDIDGGISIAELLASREPWSGELRIRRRDGAGIAIGGEVRTFTDARDRVHACILLHGAVRHPASRHPASRRLLEAQKLEAIGHLASGIAHEINTPTQYIGDNLRFLQTAFMQLTALLPVPPSHDTAAAQELGYLAEEIPSAIDQSLHGVDQVSRIVGALKQFATAGIGEVTLVDLNQAVESILTVSRNEWKYVADVVRELDVTLPLVPCADGAMKQVILSLVIRAAQAIADAHRPGDGALGTITVRTRRSGGWVELRVEDTGPGISEEIAHRVFDPCYATEQSGHGKGYSLASAHDVVVEKHRGTLRCEPVSGRGTAFIVRLPLHGDVTSDPETIS